MREARRAWARGITSALLKPFWVDLHIHTLLSPCGELEMGAPEVIEKAREAGLDIIGIADHNTCENYPGMAGAAQNGGRPGVPVVLPCIEAQSAGVKVRATMTESTIEETIVTEN